MIFTLFNNFIIFLNNIKKHLLNFYNFILEVFIKNNFILFYCFSFILLFVFLYFFKKNINLLKNLINEKELHFLFKTFIIDLILLIDCYIKIFSSFKKIFIFFLFFIFIFIFFHFTLISILFWFFCFILFYLYHLFLKKPFFWEFKECNLNTSNLNISFFFNLFWYYPFLKGFIMFYYIFYLLNNVFNKKFKNLNFTFFIFLLFLLFFRVKFVFVFGFSYIICYLSAWFTDFFFKIFNFSQNFKLNYQNFIINIYIFYFTEVLSTIKTIKIIYNGNIIVFNPLNYTTSEIKSIHLLIEAIRILKYTPVYFFKGLSDTPHISIIINYNNGELCINLTHGKNFKFFDPTLNIYTYQENFVSFSKDVSGFNKPEFVTPILNNPENFGFKYNLPNNFVLKTEEIKFKLFIGIVKQFDKPIYKWIDIPNHYEKLNDNYTINNILNNNNFNGLNFTMLKKIQEFFKDNSKIIEKNGIDYALKNAFSKAEFELIVGKKLDLQFFIDNLNKQY